MLHDFAHILPVGSAGKMQAPAKPPGAVVPYAEAELAFAEPK
jgi:hypothetical protein